MLYNDNTTNPIKDYFEIYDGHCWFSVRRVMDFILVFLMLVLILVFLCFFAILFVLLGFWLWRNRNFQFLTEPFYATENDDFKILTSYFEMIQLMATGPEYTNLGNLFNFTLSILILNIDVMHC